MGWEAWFTIGVALLVLVLIGATQLGTDLVLLSGQDHEVRAHIDRFLERLMVEQVNLEGGNVE